MLTENSEQLTLGNRLRFSEQYRSKSRVTGDWGEPTGIRKKNLQEEFSWLMEKIDQWFQTADLLFRQEEDHLGKHGCKPEGELLARHEFVTNNLMVVGNKILADFDYYGIELEENREGYITCDDIRATVDLLRKSLKSWHSDLPEDLKVNMESIFCGD